MDTSYDDEADTILSHNALLRFIIRARSFSDSPVVELVVIFKLLLLDVCLSIVEYIFIYPDNPI